MTKVEVVGRGRSRNCSNHSKSSTFVICHFSLWLLVLLLLFSLSDCSVKRSLAFAFVINSGSSINRNRIQSRTGNPTTKKMTATESSSTSTSVPTTSTVCLTDNPKPNIPIPDPIYSNVPGTWSYDTMKRRVNEEILQRTYEDNVEEVFHKADEKFQSVIDKFQSLRDDLQCSAKLRMVDKPLSTTTGDSKSDNNYTSDELSNLQREYDEWALVLQPLVDNNDTWLSAPWLVAEFLVYRRLVVDVFGYWDKSSPLYQYDPFQKQKHAGLVSSVGSAEPMLAKILQLHKLTSASTADKDVSNTAGGGDLDDGVGVASSIALWGNKMDLSLWPADAANANVDIFSSILEKATENLLHDDTKILSNHCKKLRDDGGGNVDIIVDNAGFELITDLALATYLVESGIAKCVTFQLKSHPTFVSDALEKDLMEHIEHYASLDESGYPNARAAGIQWKQYLADGRWVAHEDNFWVQPFAMWDMTEPLRSDLATRCDLAFVKGDANYRRLLGDCRWDMTAPFEDVVGAYFPCPVCALRTLKAEIGCGMDQNQIDRAKSLDDNWQTNGRFGVVHFGNGATTDS